MKGLGAQIEDLILVFAPKALIVCLSVQLTGRIIYRYQLFFSLPHYSCKFSSPFQNPEILRLRHTLTMEVEPCVTAYEYLMRNRVKPINDCPPPRSASW